MFVTMNFGDGNSVPLEMEAENPDEAIEEAATFILDNVFLTVEDDEGNIVADKSLSSTNYSLRR